MNIRKFISGVSAFAVAATAFAAMAVTASATNYNNLSPSSGKVMNLTSNNDGTYAVKNTNIAVVLANLDGLTDIDKASSVTVQFETMVPLVGTKLAKIMYGVGDKAERGDNGNGSSKDNYKKEGLVTYFGSELGTDYYLNGKGDNYASSVHDVAVQATITLNRETGEYTAKLATSKATISDSGITDVKNITVIEAVTWGASAAYNVTFKNVKVSYTVPGAPTAGAPVEVDLGDLGTNDGVYAKAYTTDITYDGIAIKNVKVDVPNSAEGPQTISFGSISGDVRIGIILASEDASKIADVTPIVTVNAE